MLFSYTGSTLDDGITIDDGSTTEVPVNSSQQTSSVDSDSFDHEQVKEHEASTSVTSHKDPGTPAPAITKREKRKRKLDASDSWRSSPHFRRSQRKDFLHGRKRE